MLKKIKSFLIIFICLFITSNIIAQNMESDAIMFGTNNNNGTARFVAVGGAMSAIGGDVTNISYNPAGIGLYKSSVIVFTPSYEINKTDAVYSLSSRQRMLSKLYISNFGAVFHMPITKHSAMKSFNIGLAYNSLNSFNNKNVFQLGTSNSISQNWVNEATTVNGNEELEFSYDNFSFETVGAYSTWLVNFDTTSQTYISPINNKILQKRISIRNGGKKDFALAFSTNLYNKLYLGTSISLPSISYYGSTKFTEKDEYNVNGNFEKFELNQTYKNTGYGANIKIGAIFKPVSVLRLSASIQTKTRYSLKEQYTSDFVTTFDTSSFELESPQGEFEYSLATPWRANAGIAFVHKKIGFVSFDYELVDYASTKFHLDEDYSDLQNKMNSNIKDKYQIAHNFKVGAELKYKKFRVRAGYNMQTSPLKSTYREGNFDFSRQQFSGGVGYLWDRISLDAAYRYSLSKEYEHSFDGVNGIYKNNDTQLMSLTVGFKINR